MKCTATNQMHMQVKYRLAGLWADIQHRPVSIFNCSVAGNVGGSKVTETNQFGFFGSGFFEPGNVLFRDDQDMSWTLRVEILKRENVIIFKNFLRWHFSADNAAKKTVRHGRLLTFAERRKLDCSK